jgi:TatD DNase family protein
MNIIDTHTHIYLPEFKADLPAVMDRAAAKGIAQMLLPAIDSSTHEAMLALAATYPQCRPMMGLHPCSVNQDFQAELEIVAAHVKNQSFVAVGEIGLDFYWDKTFVTQQYQAFHQQIDLAHAVGLPIVIHSRNATSECIDVVQQHPGTTGVFHCFSGGVEQAEAVLSMGMFLGIGGVVSFKNGGLDKVIAAVGLDGVVLETDAPYLAPVPNRGKRNEPAYLEYVVAKLCAITGKEAAEVCRITTENAKRLFNLS